MEPLKAKYGHVVDEVLIFRFLSGNKFDVQLCDKLIDAMLKFRQDKNLDAIKEEAVRMDQMEFPQAEKVFRSLPQLISYGFTKDGSPLSIDRAGMIDPQLLVDTCTLEELELHTLYHLENKMHLLNELSRKTGKLVLGCKILDLTGLGLKHAHTTALGYMRQMSHSGQANYPEMLDKMIIVNAPTVFTVIWGLVKHMLHARNQSKILVLGANYQEELNKLVAADQLPLWLGGTHPGEDPFMTFGFSPRLCSVNVPRGTLVEKSFEVSGGERFKVEWEVTSSAESFDFEVLFRGNVVESGVKCRGVYKGSFEDTEPGELVVKLDNRESIFTSKDFQYRIQTFVS
eukprot:TRINITY_DN21057_c0_g1_i1.p1 TRINITY_DN21057_c0_g1~~TRINITY_DN21057_c0_g1_i1.p1  ORF type:complete len:390 (-),score=109.69 TRINITY_DN21057_c0_g1_i1:30-1058(-)